MQREEGHLGAAGDPELSGQKDTLHNTHPKAGTGPAGDPALLGGFVLSVTRTHDVLKKARTNLEVRGPLHQTEPQSPAHIHPHLSSESAGDPRPALTFQKISCPHGGPRSSINVLLAPLPAPPLPPQFPVTLSPPCLLTPLLPSCRPSQESEESK